MRNEDGTDSVWLIGAGSMSREYAKVLVAGGYKFEVVGRSEVAASEFEASTDIPVRRGGLQDALSESPAPCVAIVAVGVEQLAAHATSLLEAGTRRVLVEKPAGAGSSEVRELWRIAEALGAEIFVGYNRRFYSSVLLARKLIKEDGGATSCVFSLTERSKHIADLDLPDAVKESWFLSNTSHVVDLVFHLCGEPGKLSPYVSGSLPWHPRSARFVGSGMTEHGAAFSYHGDWEAPGGWGIEVCTRHRRLRLRPLEELHMAVLGSDSFEELTVDDQSDREFKPGLHGLTQAFMRGDDEMLCHLEEQVGRWRIYDRIAGYEDSRD